MGGLVKALETIFRVADRYPWLRPLLVFSGTFVTAWWMLGLHLGPRDFSVFYLAAGPGPIYDPTWIARLENHPGVWAFAYPPTFLLILRPLHLLPYPAAFSLWVAGSAVLFVEAAGRLSRLPWVLMLIPVVVYGAFLGQTPMFIGGLVVLGMTLLDAPLLAGTLFGIAFAIKPQVILLLPIALAMSGHWRVLLAMGAAGLALCVASLIFGPALWVQWVQCLPGFVAINERAATIPVISVPAAFIPEIAAASLVALWLTRRADVSTRLLVLIGGSLLLSPHAVEYELAMLLPPLLGLAYRWRSLLYRAPRLSRSA